jgi:hypothetical protein
LTKQFTLNYTAFSKPQIVQNLSSGLRRSAVGFKAIRGYSYWVTTTGEELDPREWAVFNVLLGEVVI